MKGGTRYVGTFEAQHRIGIGNAIQEVRDRKIDMVLSKDSRQGLRYCETCHSLKPKNNRPLIKGWKCTYCAK
jgi:hypothetical protein